jgi:FixJ family two-component response regulator
MLYLSIMNSSGLTVAIVDDDETVRRAMRRLISSLSCRPVEFASGEAFLNGLHEFSPSLALIDMHMPRMSGIDVLLRMRSDGSAIPAIIITGGDEPRLRERCLNAGAWKYLVKPIDRATISAIIDKLMSE